MSLERRISTKRPSTRLAGSFSCRASVSIRTARLCVLQQTTWMYLSVGDFERFVVDAAGVRLAEAELAPLGDEAAAWCRS